MLGPVSGFVQIKVSFQPSQPKLIQRAPTSYQFVGSNDAVCNDFSTWTVLCGDVSDQAWTSLTEVKYCKVKAEIREKFRCLGVRVLKNRDPDGWVVIRNIRMWERIVSVGRVEL